MALDQGMALTMEQYHRWHPGDKEDPKDAPPAGETLELRLAPDDAERYEIVRAEMLDRLKEGTPAYTEAGSFKVRQQPGSFA